MSALQEASRKGVSERMAESHSGVSSEHQGTGNGDGGRESATSLHQPGSEFKRLCSRARSVP